MKKIKVILVLLFNILLLQAYGSTFSFNMPIYPQVFNILGGGAYCQGGPGVQIDLDGSEPGITYELYLNNLPTGIEHYGTGLPLVIAMNVTITGSYTVVASDGVNPVLMNGTAVVTLAPNPLQYLVMGGGAICQGGTGVTIGLTNSNLLVTYYLYLNGSPVVPPVTQAGVNGPFVFPLQTDPGAYTVKAVDDVTGCFSFMNGIAFISYEAPNITCTCPANALVCSLPGLDYTPVSNLNPIITSNCPYTYSYSLTGATPGSGNGTVSNVVDFKVGVTQVEYSVTDNYGSTVTCSFNVEVIQYQHADAGADQTVCAPNSVMLMGNSPDPGFTPLWAQVSGPPVTITQMGAQAMVNMMSTAGSYVFSYQLTNGPCYDIDYVTITVVTNGFASAGPDQSYCNTASFNLNANTPSSGYGEWTLTSGPNIPAFNVNDPHALVTGVVPGVYLFTWTVQNPPCSPNFSNVIITIEDGATANAGPDVVVCPNPPEYTLSGASATNYSQIYWTTSGDGTFVLPGDLNPVYQFGPNDLVTGNIQLTLHADGVPPCPDATDIMTITIGSKKAGQVLSEALPGVYHVIPIGTICNADSVAVGLDHSETGVDYELYLNNIPTGITVTGTGLPISFGLQLTDGTYTVSGNSTCSTVMMNGSITLPFSYANDSMFSTDFNDSTFSNWVIHNNQNGIITNSVSNLSLITPGVYGIEEDYALQPMAMPGISWLYNSVNFKGNYNCLLGDTLFWSMKLNSNDTTDTIVPTIYLFSGFNPEQPVIFGVNPVLAAKYIMDSAFVENSWSMYFAPLSQCSGGNMPSNTYGHWQMVSPGSACNDWANLLSSVDAVAFEILDENLTTLDKISISGDNDKPTEVSIFVQSKDCGNTPVKIHVAFKGSGFDGYTSFQFQQSVGTIFVLDASDIDISSSKCFSYWSIDYYYRKKVHGKLKPYIWKTVTYTTKVASVTADREYVVCKVHCQDPCRIYVYSTPDYDAQIDVSPSDKTNKSTGQATCFFDFCFGTTETFTASATLGTLYFDHWTYRDQNGVPQIYYANSFNLLINSLDCPQEIGAHYDPYYKPLADWGDAPVPKYPTTGANAAYHNRL
ncbi:MAG: hypothetical protein NTU44_02520 [Bacteroidetes bacterium]|nr:hypothetical protein [Bacteroidota bacterium]